MNIIFRIKHRGHPRLFGPTLVGPIPLTMLTSSCIVFNFTEYRIRRSHSSAID